MAKTKARTPSDIETKVLAAIEAGLSYDDIALRFSMSTKTISRIKKRVNGFEESAPPPKDIAPAKRSDTPSRAERARKTHETIQTEIASVALTQALKIFKSIDVDKLPEGQKATSGAILIDKARLITGQAGSITEHREIGVVALRLLDERQKKAKERQPTIIDVTPEYVNESPRKQDDTLQ